MILIDNIESDRYNIRFYNGIDFDEIKKHPEDGSRGMLICYIENWVDEVKSYNRTNKIKSILGDDEYNDLDWSNEINNNHVSIYQTDGIGLEELHKVIKGKILKLQIPNQPWISIPGNKVGAWNLNNKNNTINN
jgi:hypothetical protein